MKTTQEPSSRAITGLMTELMGDDAAAIIATHTNIRPDVARNRMANRGDWTIREFFNLSDMIGVNPAQLVAVVNPIAEGEMDLGTAARQLARDAQED